jgi:hypothetical protein
MAGLDPAIPTRRATPLGSAGLAGCTKRRRHTDRDGRVKPGHDMRGQLGWPANDHFMLKKMPFHGDWLR